MIFCLAHMRYELWGDDECYGWVAAEVPPEGLPKIREEIVHRYLTGQAAPLRPRPEGCFTTIRQPTYA